MSHTTRRHEAPSAYHKRGPKNKPFENPNDKFKTRKQRRVRAKAALRKEW